MNTLADCLSRRLTGIEVRRFACGYPNRVLRSDAPTRA